MGVFYGNAVAINADLIASTSTSSLHLLPVQLSPFGEFTLHDGGKMNGTVQHCTRAAFEAMVANWRAAGSPEILVDVDHNSATGRSPKPPQPKPREGSRSLLHARHARKGHTEIRQE